MSQSTFLNDLSKASTKLNEMALVIRLLCNTRQPPDLKRTKAMEDRYVVGILNIQKSLEELQKTIPHVPSMEAKDMDSSDRRCLEKIIQDSKNKQDPKERLDILRGQAKLLVDRAGQLYSSNKDNRKALPAMENFGRKIGEEIRAMNAFFEKCHSLYSGIAPGQRVHSRRSAL